MLRLSNRGRTAVVEAVPELYSELKSRVGTQVCTGLAAPGEKNLIFVQVTGEVVNVPLKN